MERHSLFLTTLVSILFLSGCTAIPNASTPTTGIASGPAMMTLPRFLGLDTVAGGCSRLAYRTRVRLTPIMPMLKPNHNPPVLDLGHPANLTSPSPAVAAAATIQQSEAEAPAKVSALAFLANYSCSSNPQIEESFLAGMDDLSATVRAAAVQAVIDGSHCCKGKQCGSCNGCCTVAVSERLMKMAYQRNENGCYCEPSSHVRRLARIAIESCGCSAGAIYAAPTEVPPKESVEQVYGTSELETF